MVGSPVRVDVMLNIVMNASGGRMLLAKLPERHWVDSVVVFRVTALQPDGRRAATELMAPSGVRQRLLSASATTSFMLVPSRPLRPTAFYRRITHGDGRAGAEMLLAQPPPRAGFIVLLYSEDYAGAAKAMARSLLDAHLQFEARYVISLTVMVGCTPEAAPVVDKTYDRIHDLAHLDGDTGMLVDGLGRCRPMVSADALYQLWNMNGQSTSMNIQKLHFVLVPRLHFAPGVPIIGLDSGVWMKLHAWALEDIYDCAVMLDADMIIMKPLRDLHRLSVCARREPSMAGVDTSSTGCVMRSGRGGRIHGAPASTPSRAFLQV